MTHTLDFPRAAPAAVRFGAGIWRKLGDAITRVVRNQANEWVVRRAIASLNALDDRTLRDIGLHRSEIESRVRRQLTRDW